MQNAHRNAQIIRMAETMTYGEIAAKLGVSRSLVAGVVFRHKNPDRGREYWKAIYRYGDREAARQAVRRGGQGWDYAAVMRKTGLARLRRLALENA